MSAVKNMQYVTLGKSGLKISRLILGTMTYGSTEWFKWCLDEKTGIKHIKYAYDAGINTFDTADIYSNGQSEIILGKALKQHKIPREEVVIMTKIFGTVYRSPSTLDIPDKDKAGYVNQYGLSRKHVFDAVKSSLNRLQLDYVDVLQCHRFDENTPIEETMQALHDVVQAGYARYIGMSSCWAWQFHAMQNYAIANKLTPFISMQNHYSLVYREEEREMMPTLKNFGVSSIPWSPLAKGFLTRPIGKKDTNRSTTDFFLGGYIAKGREANTDIVKRVEEIAKKKGCSMAQIALAWVLAKDVVAAPVIGSTSVEKLQGLIDALNVNISEEEIAYLEEPYLPQPISGHA